MRPKLVMAPGTIRPRLHNWEDIWVDGWLNKNKQKPPEQSFFLWLLSNAINRWPSSADRQPSGTAAA